MLVGCRRQIPGTQKSREPIPLLQEDLEAGHPDDPAPAKGGGQEPTWMKLSVTAPARKPSKVGPAMFPRARLTQTAANSGGVRDAEGPARVARRHAVSSTPPGFLLNII